MKRIFVVFLIFSGATFFGLIGYAGFAPAIVVSNPVLLALFRISGAGVFVAIIYFIAKLFLMGLRSARRKQ